MSTTRVFIAMSVLCCTLATGPSNAEPAVSQQLTPCGADTRSNRTSCAEEDNVNIPLYAGKAVQFKVIATHPLYQVGADNCQADFSGCLSSARLRAAQVADICETLLDDGISVVRVCTVQQWWRPYTMNVVTESGRSSAGHYLVLSRKIQGEESWPQFLVLYEDSNVRLKPHPREGTTDNCFGSSILIGPAAAGARPFVDIEKIFVRSSPLSLDVTYRGATATTHLDVSVDRSQAVVTTQVAYANGLGIPFATFRSMWVGDGNADVDHIENQNGDFAILGGWSALGGPWWFFHRNVRSRHNTSAPDIRIEAVDVFPELLLSVNSWLFSRGETLVLSAAVIPGVDRRSADAYVGIEIPGGSQLFSLRDGSFVVQARPIVQQWTPDAFRGDLVTHTFNGSDPSGGYTWFGVFTEPGSLIPIGCVGRASFMFSP